jgi:hypothetical protein
VTRGDLVKRYARNVLVAIDQLLNALTGGDPDETVSSRLAKRPGWIGRAACWLLDRVDPGHCARVREPDEGRDALW